MAAPSAGDNAGFFRRGAVLRKTPSYALVPRLSVSVFLGLATECFRTMAWAFDIGNSNTKVARWDETLGGPRLLELPEICREPGSDEPMAAPRLVPTATEVLEAKDLKTRIGAWPWLKRRVFLGRRALIGRPALERSLGFPRPSFAPAFKPFLDREALRVIARTPSQSYTARDVAELFLQELLATIRRRTGERVRELVITHPVEAFETYRSELLTISRRLGIKRLRFIDEPVAAALGYGLSIDRDRTVLVVDFGAGTLHVALVTLSRRGIEQGRAHVLAKGGEALGGHQVDGWLFTAVAREYGMSADTTIDSEEERYWQRVMVNEARRVKEALFFDPLAIFNAVPPAYLRREPQANPAPMRVELTRERLVSILEHHRLYERIEKLIDRVLAVAVGEHRVQSQEIDDVLVIGGSTLLPGVYPLLERRFGRDRVRAWQPFEAVALGACVLSHGSFAHSDLIAHDYAFVTYDPESHKKQYTVIVPAGTRVPTDPRLWAGKLVPTCALGAPESLFKLSICEIARGGSNGQRFAWDAGGALHRLDNEENAAVIVPLNESDPTLGQLDPPHSPRDRRPRLEVAFGVNAERWLCATVDDLITGKRLLDGAQVSRLL